MNNRRLCILALLIGWTMSISAAPALSGSTGLITIPTAQSLQYREFNFGSHAVFGNSGSGIDSESVDYAYTLNFGTFENLELGFVGGKEPDEGVFINAKYYLMGDQARFPVSLALGTEYLTSRSKSSIYMVASKKVREDLGLHFGFKAIFAETLSPAVMGGLDFMLTEQMEIIWDINGDGNTYSFNLGSRFYLTSEWVISAAALNLASLSEQASELLIGTSYSKFF